MKKFLLISILLTPGVVFGKTISGMVVDEKDNPVKGVYVQDVFQSLIGSKNGTFKGEPTQTDKQGKFSLESDLTSNAICVGEGRSLIINRVCVPIAEASKITFSKATHTKSATATTDAPVSAPNTDKPTDDNTYTQNTITISGKVVKENEEPLQHAAVFATNQTDIGDSTGPDGKFQIIKFPISERSISISFLGYKTQQKQASECTLQNPCTIRLEEESTELEVVDIVASPICGTDEVNAEHHATQTKLLKKQDGSTYCAPANQNSCLKFYKYKNGQCVSIDGDNCFDTKKHETSGTWECQTDGNENNTACSCVNKKCESGYELNDSGTSCEKITIDCTRFLNELNATAAKQKTTSLATQDTPEQDLYKYCYPTECNAESGYTINGSGEKAVCVKVTGNDCTSQITGASKATLTYDAQKKQIICKVSECNENLYLKKPQNNTCKSKDGTECTIKDDHLERAEYDCVEDECTCKIQKCTKGYTPSIDGESCVEKKCECGKIWDKNERKCIEDSRAGKACPNTNKGIESGTYKCVDNGEMTCIVTECSDGYKPDGFLSNGKTDPTKCVKISGSCTPDDSNAKSGHLTYNKEKEKEICVIDSCKKYYKLSEDGQSCELSNKHSEAELKEKSDNVNKLRDNEQSAANKITSGVTMATTGIGGMMLAQSLSEQRVDKESEQDMAAYLATFRCEYAGGTPVPGGTIGAQLPADKLFDLYQEYVTLAADVQEAKSQLGLKPGIESEVVLDKANIGLYDDTSTGTTNGTYASLYRALSDSSSMDAQKWNDQKAQTNKNLKIGIGVVAGGAALGEAGNILTNYIDWDKIKDKTNNSKENKDKIKMLKDGLESVGFKNVNKLDFSKLDLTEFDVNSIDFTKIKLSDATDATKLLNTTNAASWKSSFSKIYPTE